MVVPVLRYFSAALLMALMLLTCLDVSGRYLLNSPIWGAFELTEMALAALIFAALPMVSLHNHHVTVDLLDAMTPGWLFRVQHALASLVGATCTGYLAWRLWIRAENLAAAGETTAQLRIPINGLAYTMAVLMAFTAFAFLIVALRKPRRQDGEDTPEAPT